MHDIHKFNVKIVGSDSKPVAFFGSSPRHVIKSAFYMMVFHKFKHTSIITREKERERERDSCLMFRGKTIVL